MLLSLITATYNSSATLADTLTSVREQSYPHLEHLIVDGLSSDPTLSILRKFPHARLVVSERDSGIYEAMNKGILAAKGEVIGLLNSDDLYINKEVVQKVMSCFQNPAIDAVYGDLQFVAADNIHRVVRTWRAGTYRRNKLYWGWMPPHPTFFVRKQLYEQWGLFNTQLKSAADYELILRFLLKANLQLFYIPEVLVKMRVGGASNASLHSRILAHREDYRAWKINGLTPYPWTVACKPLRKISQYFA
jgi:glycosyltransferase involved in cell wall biosynthesis